MIDSSHSVSVFTIPLITNSFYVYFLRYCLSWALVGQSYTENTAIKGYLSLHNNNICYCCPSIKSINDTNEFSIKYCVVFYPYLMNERHCIYVTNGQRSIKNEKPINLLGICYPGILQLGEIKHSSTVCLHLKHGKQTGFSQLFRRTLREK